MKANIFCCMTAITFLPAHAEQSASSEPESKIIELFNGKDLTGWTAFLGKAEANADGRMTVSDNYRVKDGILHIAGMPLGYLRTEKKYTNFELWVDWRWPRPNVSHEDAMKGIPPNNSGILLRVGSPDRLWPMAYEAELSEYRAASYRDLSDVGDIAILGYDKASFKSEPSLINSLGPPDGTIGFSFKDFHRVRYVSAENPIGEWNTYHIIFDQDRLRMEVNGVLVNEGSGAEIVPGYIALQSERAPIEFRNIRLKSLDH